MQFRPYDPDRDLDAVRRIWRECGWIETDQGERGMDAFIADAEERWVADIDGVAECFVVGAMGDIEIQSRRLPYGLVAAVTTSFVARRQGLAGRLTAHLVRRLVERGAVVCGLGMFEQGYYDRLGFGTGNYEHFAYIAPDALRVPHITRSPVRLSADHAEEIHACRMRRMRWHGSVSVFAPGITHETLIGSTNGLGLGFRDQPDGGISHMIWLDRKGGAEYGPYRCLFMAYETWDQLRELLGVIKSLGSQVQALRLYDHPALAWSSLTERPVTGGARTAKGDYAQRTVALAWWQTRVADVAACISAVELAGADYRFQLNLTDPISDHLDTSSEAAWSGQGGPWVVSLGPTCSATRGVDPALPVVDATINAWSRLWIGSASPGGLSLDGSLKAEPAVLEALGNAWQVPKPCVDWDK